MWWHVACDALSAGKRLSITYGGHTRVVEVHAVGTTDDGNPVMRAWQVSGGSRSRNPDPWRLFRLDRTWQYAILDEASEAPRRGYKRGDSHIARIRCQV
jgi:predicted DNA-binding transcriptional regulator YafY